MRFLALKGSSEPVNYHEFARGAEVASIVSFVGVSSPDALPFAAKFRLLRLGVERLVRTCELPRVRARGGSRVDCFFCWGVEPRRFAVCGKISSSALFECTMYAMNKTHRHCPVRFLALKDSSEPVNYHEFARSACYLTWLRGGKI